MHKIRLTLLIGSAVQLALVSGCAVMEHPKERMPIPMAFDEAAALKMLAPGAATIRGSAAVRQVGGGVVTCAGEDVDLVPDTAYAKWRMQAYYGGTYRGYRNVQRPDVVFEPNVDAYHQARRTTRCDAQGRFEFTKVGPGSYFVITRVVWTVGGGGRYNAHGGALMHSAIVNGSDDVNLVLAP